MFNQRPAKNFKELSIENKSMPIGWRQENVITSETDHAWAVEWMRLAGCSPYKYTVSTYSIWGLFFIAVAFFPYTVLQKVKVTAIHTTVVH
jgi:hypothetical protein